MPTPKPDNTAMNTYIRAQRTIPAFEMPATVAEINAEIRRLAGRPIEEPTKEEEPST